MGLESSLSHCSIGSVQGNSYHARTTPRADESCGMRTPHAVRGTSLPQAPGRSHAAISSTSEPACSREGISAPSFQDSSCLSHGQSLASVAWLCVWAPAQTADMELCLRKTFFIPSDPFGCIRAKSRNLSYRHFARSNSDAGLLRLGYLGWLRGQWNPSGSQAIHVLPMVM